MIMKKLLLLLLCAFSVHAIDIDLDKNPYRPTLEKEDMLIYNELKPLFETNKNEALRLLKEKTSTDRSASFAYIEGILNLQMKKPQDSIAPLKEAIKKMPSFVDAHRALAQAYNQTNQLAKTNTQLLKIISLGFGDAKLWSSVASLYHQQENYLAAETAYRNALVFDPSNKNLLSSLAQVYLNEEKYTNAQVILKQLLKDSPKSRQLRLSLINCQLKLGKNTKALENFEIANHFQLLKSRDLITMADLYEEEKNAELAVLYYQTALKDKTLKKELVLYCLQALLRNDKNKAFASHIATIPQASLKPQELEQLSPTEWRQSCEK